MTVNGTASKWIVGGSLQVGGFDLGLQGVTVGDTEGDNVLYNSEAGRGTLYVQAGGLVNVVNAIGADRTPIPNYCWRLGASAASRCPAA